MPGSRDRTPFRVNDEVLEADRIFLNVGGRAVVPNIQPSDVDYLTNVGILDLDVLPEHLVIIGGSYIALEFAGDLRLRRAGHRPAKGPALDRARGRGRVHRHATSSRLRASRFPHRGPLHADRQAGRRVQSLARRRRTRCSSTRLVATDGNPTPTTSASTSQAWRPTPIHRHRRPCGPTSTTSGRWGTATARAPSPTRRYNDFEIVAANLFDDDPRRVSDRITTYAMYIDSRRSAGRACPSTRCASRAAGRCVGSGR